MKVPYWIFTACLLTLTACHKDITDRPQPPAPSTPPPAGTPAVLGLKDMNVSSLPSPYYHFEYNDSGLISLASHTGGLAIYAIDYTGKDILAMKNIAGNSDVLHYNYANDHHLSYVSIQNNTGLVYRRVFFAFTASGQVESLNWDVLDGNDFATERSQVFTYYSDGNLNKLVEKHFAVGPQTESTVTDVFEDYDDKVNVDDFGLLHPEQFMHLVLLTGSKLQLNNPHRVTRTGDGLTYRVDYNYTYDNSGRPLTRNGDILLNNTADAGKHVPSRTTYSYYH